MRRTVLLAAMTLICVLRVSAQQHNLDTQKSTLTIHVGKTGVFSGLGHEHEVHAPIQAARRIRVRIPQLKCTWMRARCV